jgi:hypothetical protein
MAQRRQAGHRAHWGHGRDRHDAIAQQLDLEPCEIGHPIGGLPKPAGRRGASSSAAGLFGSREPDVASTAGRADPQAWHGPA